jgi:hypothetical protein
MRFTSPLAAALLAAAGFMPNVASAENYSLWIHGRQSSNNTQQGNYGDFSYWGPASALAGVNKKAVNWGGAGHISETNHRIRDALDCFCTGSNWCYIAAHSAGDPQIGYALALYGGSSRAVKNASAGADGVCGDAGGTQTGWNIRWVDISAGAGGGTELSDVGGWATGDGISLDLKTATVRSMYDHNATGSRWFYRFAGARGAFYDFLLPGQDDQVIPYHSSGGLSSTGRFCNPGDWFCDDSLQTGTAGSRKSGALIPKWSFHTVSLRDDGEAYDHYANSSWAGIVGPVRRDMELFAL